MSEPENPGARIHKVALNADRRSILIGVGLAASGAISFFAAPKATARPISQSNFRSAIPKNVGRWVSRSTQEIVLPPQDDSNKLYENQETRIYEGQGLPSVMFLVAFSSIQQNDVHVHRPEVCYPAGGFPIISNARTRISYLGKEFQARELVADRGGLKERIIYWTRVGTSFPTTWREQRITMALANLEGSVPDGVLFRVSALEDPGTNISEALRIFIQTFLNSLSPSFRDTVLL